MTYMVPDHEQCICQGKGRFVLVSKFQLGDYDPTLGRWVGGAEAVPSAPAKCIYHLTPMERIHAQRLQQTVAVPRRRIDCDWTGGGEHE